MIAIGSHMGGPELKDSPIDFGTRTAMRAAADTRGEGYDSGEFAWVNAIFIVPGSLSKPKFVGYEFGHFSRKEKGLVIKIAVPQSVADGRDIPEFIVAALREVAKLAETYFARKSIVFSAAKAEVLIAKIEVILHNQTKH